MLLPHTHELIGSLANILDFSRVSLSHPSSINQSINSIPQVAHNFFFTPVDISMSQAIMTGVVEQFHYWSL